MKLKRVYVDDKLSHVEVKSAPRVQKISTKLAEQMVSQGLMTLGNYRVTIKTHADEPDLEYRIASGPGYYCCHCNATLGGEREGRSHVEAEHKGAESPDPNNPSGYRRDLCYTCVLVGEGNEGMTAEDAEKAAQDARREALARIGAKHREAVARSVAKQREAQEQQPAARAEGGAK